MNESLYVATIEIAGQTPYKLYLLPEIPDRPMTHQEAMGWAQSVGGDLPSRPEQALLFAHQRVQKIDLRDGSRTMIGWRNSSDERSAGRRCSGGVCGR